MAKRKNRKNKGGGDVNPSSKTRKTNEANAAAAHEKVSKKNFGNAAANIPAHAPYNFIPFSETVYEYPKSDIPKQNDMRPDLLSGEIEYMVTSLSPIFINAGEQAGKQAGFYKDAYGRFAIPGSTMRGMIRSNLQILGLSNLREEVQDQRLMYRNIAGAAKRERKRYQDILGTEQVMQNGHQITVINNVQGGYIENIDGEYRIRRAVSVKLPNKYGSMNYYTIRESKGHRYGKDLCEVKDADWAPVWYSVNKRGEISSISLSEKPNLNKGAILKSGKMPNKKAVYIIPEINEGVDGITIPDEDIKNFRIDYNIRENQLGDDREFFALPEEGKRKPVFFIELDGRLYFGFTPHLRLYYDHSILEGMPHKAPAEDTTDYCKAIFGEVSGDKAVKSRVSFSDAVVNNRQAKEITERKLILGAPKPTDYHDYLVPDKNGKAKSYNDDGFRLRGVKQYWLHEGGKPERTEYDSNNSKVFSSLMPLPKGEHFTGKVRFRNLTKEELGLLLWSIKLKDGCQMNVGMAKSYGYGKISLTIKKFSLKNLEKSYDLTKGLSLDTGDLLPEEAIDEYIREYTDAAAQRLGGKNIESLASIRDFFSMKTPGSFDERDIPTYMQIEKFPGPGEQGPKGKKSFNEFVESHKKMVLPSVQEIAGRRKN